MKQYDYLGDPVLVLHRAIKKSVTQRHQFGQTGPIDNIVEIRMKSGGQTISSNNGGGMCGHQD